MKRSDRQSPLTRVVASFLLTLYLAMGLLGQTASAITITLLGGGESSPPSGYHRVEQASASVSYGGNWNTESTNLTQSFSGGTAATSMAAGSQASFRFSGTAV